MFRDELFQEMIAAGPRGSQRVLTAVLAGLVAAGGAAFLLGVLGADPARAWQAYHTNFVFWTGLAFGAVLFAAMLSVVNARWGRPMKRLAEAFAAFLPVAFVLFWGLYAGRETLFPWIHEPVPKKAAWLNVPFLFARDGAALLVLTAVAGGLLRISIGGDRKMIADGSRTEGQEHRYKVLSIVYTILYAFLLTLLAFDLIMSLSPHWYSTLFGAYYFIANFYMGLAALFVLAVIGVKGMGLGRFIQPGQFHDLGKLILAFCLLSADFFYTQFFIIWYGNLPEETRYIIHRAYLEPWRPLVWAILVVCFGLPFVVLLSRRIKRRLLPMTILCCTILAGMWLERFLLVVPSLWKGSGIPLGVTELLITGGYFGLMALCLQWFLQRFPVLPVADPLLHEQIAGGAGREGG